MKLFLTIVFYHLFPLFGLAQTTFSTTDFLKKAAAETALAHHQQKVDFLNSNSYEIPLINKLEVRTQTDEFDWKQQEYRVRMSPSGQKERQEYRKWHQSTIEFVATEQAEILQEALVFRYGLLVDWKKVEQTLALLQQQQIVAEDRIMVLKKQVVTSDFDINDLIAAEEILHKIQQDILEEEISQKRLENFLKKDLNLATDFQMDTTNWLKFEQLKTAITALKNPSPTHPNLVQRQAKLALIDAEKSFETARNEQWFDYAEARYQNDIKNPLGKEFTIGVGIRIPFKNKVQRDLNDLNLDYLETQNDLDLKSTELVDDIAALHDRLDLLFQQHTQIALQMQESQAQFSLDQFKKMTNANPLALLKIQENLLRRQSSLQKLEAQAFDWYVDLLDLTGRVVELPLRNYLTQNLEAF